MVTKRKRVSKRNKIAWRKYAKIQDVEKYLEDQQSEDRRGKSITFKTNEELFQIDSKPIDQGVLSKKEKRKLLIERPLKCFSSLQHPTYLPQKKDARKEVVVKRLRNKKPKELKPTELQSLNDQKVAKERRKLEKEKEKFESDVWISEDWLPNTDFESNEWLSKDTRKNILRGSGRLCKNLPKITRHKQTILPSVEYPHPGTSYNPSFKDHQALLQEIVEKEQEIIKQEQHLNRVTSKIFRKVTPEENDKNWLLEMSEGLQLEPSKENPESDPETDDHVSVNPPVVNKKKDLKARRKQKEQHQLRHALALARKERRKIADIYKLRHINTKIEKQEQKSKHIQKKREEKKKQQLYEPKRVGSRKFEEPEQEFTDMKDLTGNLRTIKKQGNLLLDRLKSLQKRNIIEPTAKHINKKAKIKRFQKPGFKDDWKVTVAKAKIGQKAQIKK